MSHNISQKLPQLNYAEARYAARLYMEIGLVTMFWGSPGIGKTSVCRAMAESAGMNFRPVYLPQMNPEDVGGFVMPSPDVKSRAAFRTPPSFMPKPDDPPTLILFDEILAAYDSVRKAAFQLLMDRRIGKHRLADQHQMVAATNMGNEDRVNIVPMDTPTACRFGHLYLCPGLEDWTGEFATPAGVHPAITGFLRCNEDLFTESLNPAENRGVNGTRGTRTVIVSPRSWTRTAKLFDQDEMRSGFTPGMTDRLLGGAQAYVPGHAAARLKAFCARAGWSHNRQLIAEWLLGKEDPLTTGIGPKGRESQGPGTDRRTLHTRMTVETAAVLAAALPQYTDYEGDDPEHPFGIKQKQDLQTRLLRICTALHRTSVLAQQRIATERHHAENEDNEAGKPRRRTPQQRSKGIRDQAILACRDLVRRIPESWKERENMEPGEQGTRILQLLPDEKSRRQFQELAKASSQRDDEVNHPALHALSKAAQG